MRVEVIEMEAGFKNYLPIASIACAGFAMARLITGSSTSALLSIAAVLAGGIIAILSGTRFKVLYFLMPALICAMIGVRDPGLRQRSLVYLGILVAAILFVTAFQFQNRYGSGSVETSKFSGVVGAAHYTPLVFSIALMRDTSPFYQPMSILFITDFVPRSIWPGKPNHEYFDFFNQLAIFGGNVTPSVLGQYYMNWGLAGGVISGLIFGIWARVIDLLYCRFRISENYLFLILSAFVCAFIFLSFRHYAANYFTYVLVATIFFFAGGRARMITKQREKFSLRQRR
jgi:oligosaccharide repeat unit polymerase